MNTGRIEGSSSNSAQGWLVSGGRNGSTLSSTEVFANGSWTVGSSLPRSLYGHCQVQIGETVLVTGNIQIGIGAYIDH